jgi:SAM-dependent methyltransferase
MDIVDLLASGIPTSMLECLPDKVFVDLGSGDGRVVHAVVQSLGCRGVGVELMEDLVAQSAADAAAMAEPANGKCRFLCADMGDVDLAGADILFVYLPQQTLRHVVLHLLPRSGLRKGSIILIEDTPRDFVSLATTFGLRHLRKDDAPLSSSRPRLDLFEWTGAGFVDKRAAKDNRPKLPVWAAAE